MATKDKLVIFDTTLRDGEQSPGASMSKDEKLRIAKLLEKMHVDVIEAGFAVSSQGDFDAVKLIADTVRDSRICSLSRAMTADIERAGEALKGASAGRIHTFIATSPIHMKYKLQMEPDDVLAQAIGAVKTARDLWMMLSSLWKTRVAQTLNLCAELPRLLLKQALKPSISQIQWGTPLRENMVQLFIDYLIRCLMQIRRYSQCTAIMT